MKHSGFTYAWHLPCRFDCIATREQGAAVRSALYEEDAELVRYVDWVLTRPFLILSEWEAFGFEGKLNATGQVEYQGLFMAPTNRPDPRLWSALTDGNRLEIAGGVLRVCHGERVVRALPTLVDRFGPQVPILVDFQ